VSGFLGKWERERGGEAAKEGKNNLLPMPLRIKEEEGA
jgi:hypothetical protein